MEDKTIGISSSTVPFNRVLDYVRLEYYLNPSMPIAKKEMNISKPTKKATT
jgi:hypothetical protein